MIRLKKVVSLSVAVLMAAAIFAGCNKTADNKNTQTTASATTSSAVPRTQISYMLSPADCLTRTPDEIRAAVRTAIGRVGDSPLHLILMLPDGSDEAILDAFVEECIEQGAKIPQGQRFRFFWYDTNNNLERTLYMNEAKKKWVENLLGRMTLEQKVGQVLMFGFHGTVITPDTVDLIKKYHVGGLRISQRLRTINLFNDVKPGEEPDPQIVKSLVYPSGNHRDLAFGNNCPYTSAQEYAEMLNTLRDYALDRPLGIPLHFTSEIEGNACDDHFSSQRLFPCPTGLVSSGDPSLAYRCALAAGKQIRAIGSNVIQGPCLDVNTNPGNPEVGTRAYSDNTEDTVIYALQSLKGFQEAGIMCTGKHFPGRGESEKDAHWGLPSVDVDYDTLMSVHVKPYKALIEAGLPYIMTAHCMYPALGVAEEPGSTSCRMVTEFLRKELGFQGVIVTDNTIMGGLLMKFEMSDAIVRCLIAGHDMVLCRDDSPARLKIVNGIIDAVKSGRYPEKQLDESVYRVLSSRWDMGLPENGGKVDALKAAEPFNDPFVASTAKEAAEKTILVLRDREKLLPLDPDKKVLLIEQIFPTHLEANTHYCHPGLMWEGMIKASDNAGSVEINFKATDQDRERVFRRLGEADIIVMTNYYYHKYVKSFSDFVREVKEKSGKPVVVVTNSPYPIAAPDDFGTVVVNFAAGSKEHMDALGQILYGRLAPSAKLRIKTLEGAGQ